MPKVTQSRPSFRKTAFALAIALGLVAAGVTSATAGDPRTIGAVEKVQGSADASRAGTSRQLSARDAIVFGDRLRTGAEARLAVQLDDETKLTLGENAGITIDRFVYNPERGAGALALRVARGAFLFVGGKVEAAKGARVNIVTPSATLGVRGTTVWGGRLDGGFAVFVAQGTVTVRARRGTVTLSGGEGTLINASGRPDGVTRWGQPRIERALATVAIR